LADLSPEPYTETYLREERRRVPDEREELLLRPLLVVVLRLFAEDRDDLARVVVFRPPLRAGDLRAADRDLVFVEAPPLERVLVEPPPLGRVEPPVAELATGG
jgi:hypothetical protein